MNEERDGSHVPPAGEIPDDPVEIEAWIERFRAFHDYHRMRFYEARGRILLALELMRKRAERR